jgi:hypothetical protein
MPLSFVPPNPGYILYVDEAGDTGLRNVRPIDPDGASEWLVIGGILIRLAREPETIGWVREIRKTIKGAQRPDLHFRLLSEPRKAAVCSAIALLPLRGFVVASNKKNMRRHRNKLAEEARPSTHEWFYNYCVRLLLERVTAFIAQRSTNDYGELRHLQIVFSNRGGMRYTQTKEYYDILRNQARSGTTKLTKRVVDWRVLHPHLVTAVPAAENAGVQIADAIASSFYQAADALGPVWNPEHAKLLKPIMAKEEDIQRDYGVALQPSVYLAALTKEQQQIFEFYGYAFPQMKAAGPGLGSR